VTESVLSTVGIRDPYTGERFGRVVETGVAVESIQTLHGAWSLNGRAAASLLYGKGVALNHHLAARLGLGYNLPVRGFRYFSLGPTVSWITSERISATSPLATGATLARGIWCRE
jgi:hypothetical protein